MKQEVFEIRDHLVKNNYPNGLIAMLDDYFTNKTTSKNSPKLEIKYYKKHLPIVLLELSADVFLIKLMLY